MKINRMYGGQTLRIAVGITVLVILMVSGAGAATLTVDANGGAMYARVQDAINAANDGDTINVAAGTYNENVNVNKSVNLVGAGEDVTIVNASDPNDHVIKVTVDYVNVSGFTIKGATGGAGIYLDAVNYANISNNIALNNSEGISLAFSSDNTLINNKALNSGIGIHLHKSSNNNLIDNNASNNIDGIYARLGINNTLAGNYVLTNSIYGIGLEQTSSYILKKNSIMKNGQYGITEFSGSVSNNFTDNIVSFNNFAGFESDKNAGAILINNSIISNGGPGIECVHGSCDDLIRNNVSYNYGGGIYLVLNCPPLIENIANNNIGDGIRLEPQCGGEVLSGNTANWNSGNGISDAGGYNILNNNASNNNGTGITISSPYPSFNHYIYGNNISSNKQYGLILGDRRYLNNNGIYNNLFNNTVNVIISDVIYGNYWNVTKISGTNIIGGSYIGGNFWGKPDGTGFSQTCTDANIDGICDSPYVLNANNTDYLPLAMIKIPQQIQQINIDIQGLVTSGVLNRGQGNSLTIKLESATKDLNNGNTNAAINELQAFINKVQTNIRAKILTQEQGQVLIDAANAVISQLAG
jgi:nitrous oxidase accessory protein